MAKSSSWTFLRPRFRLSVNEYVGAVQWSADGGLLAVAPTEGATRIVRGADGVVLHELPGHGMGTTAIGWSPNGNLLATAGHDRFVKIWHGASGTEASAFEPGARSTEALRWSPTELKIATVSGKFAKVHGPNGALEWAAAEQATAFTGLTWHSGGAMLATSRLTELATWDLTSAAPLLQVSEAHAFLNVQWSSRGDFIAAGTQENTLFFWNTRHKDHLAAGPYETKVQTVAWTWGGRYVAVGGSTDVSIWDVSVADLAGTRPKFLSAHPDLVAAVEFRRKGDVLASAGREGGVYLWEPLKQDLPIAMGEAEVEATCLRWAPGGNALAVGYADGTVVVWEV